MKNRRPLDAGGGVALTEMFLLVGLSKVLHPSNILIIGNATGVSTLLLGIANPAATIVALDAETEGAENRKGNELTRKIAKEQGLHVSVVIGQSPEDVPATVAEHLEAKPDLVLIDGLHTNEQQALDFEACRAVSADQCVYILHDVLNYGMRDGFKGLRLKYEDLASNILWRTPSGMGIFYPRDAPESVQETIELFSEPADVLEATHAELGYARMLAKPLVKLAASAVPQAMLRRLRSALP